MDTLLKDGTHAVDDRGIPVSVEGTDELIQRCMIRLGVRKGSFSCDSELGSELYRLGAIEGTAADREAFSYVQEALKPLGGVEVLSASCRLTASDTLAVTTELAIDGKRMQVEIAP
ncbi:MAG: hypothetical protein ACK5LX_16165 [Oscillospiraceae bacterium]